MWIFCLSTLGVTLSVSLQIFHADDNQRKTICASAVLKWSHSHNTWLWCINHNRIYCCTKKAFSLSFLMYSCSINKFLTQCGCAGVDDWTNSIFSHLKFIAAFDLGRLKILFINLRSNVLLQIDIWMHFNTLEMVQGYAIHDKWGSNSKCSHKIQKQIDRS